MFFERVRRGLQVNLPSGTNYGEKTNWLEARLRGLVGSALASRGHFWLVSDWVGGVLVCCWAHVALLWRLCGVGAGCVPCVRFRSVSAGLGRHVARVGSGGRLLFGAPL